MYRSPARAASLVEHVFRRYGIPVAADTADGVRTAPRSATRCWRWPAARSPKSPGPTTCSSTCARPGCSRTAPTRSTGSRPRSAATVCGRWPKQRRGWPSKFPRSTPAARRGPRGGAARRARPAAAGRPASPASARARPPTRSSTPARSATLTRALAELDELGETPTGAELIELLETLEVPAGPPPAPGAVLLSDPLAIRARRFRAVLVCGLSESEFPLAAAPGAVPVRRASPRARRLQRAAPAPARGRARPRALPVLHERVPGDRAGDPGYRSSDEEGNLALPSPFLADVSELLVEDWPERRRRRMLADVVWPAKRGPHRARARPHARGRGRARSPATCPRRSARCRRRRSSTSATAGSCRRERLRATATARCGG